jgi:hypothetical protein
MGFLLVTRVGLLTHEPHRLAWLCTRFLSAVIDNNRVILREAKRRGRPILPLYQSGVRFRPERTSYEEFADLLTVLRRGWGDCDDLIAWRCAELRESGVKATARIYWRPPKNPKRPKWQMHAQLRHPIGCSCPLCRNQATAVRNEGRIEDPSRYLGMWKG